MKNPKIDRIIFITIFYHHLKRTKVVQLLLILVSNAFLIMVKTNYTILSFVIFIQLSFLVSGFSQNESTKIDPILLTETSDLLNAVVILNENPQFSTKNHIHGKNKKGEYVVSQLKKRFNSNKKELSNFLDENNITHREFYLINGFSIQTSLKHITEIAKLKSVKLIIEDAKYRVEATVSEKENDNRTTEWGIDMINAPDVWDLGYNGSGVVIGGQDTGYKWDHEALKEMYRGWDGTTATHDYNWHDAIHVDPDNNNPCGTDSPFPCDDHNHGTHTMGTMVGDNGMGKQIGVAPGAKWIACRNMDQGDGTLSTYLECFQWLLAPYPIGGDPLTDGDPAMAPHVINNSWACPTSEGCNSSNFETMREAVETLKNAGIVVVVSAGNSGSACQTVNAPPAIFEESLSVGSTTSSDVISSFSSRGPVAVDGSYRSKPNVSAPGSSVYSSIATGGYATYSGTSMAGPHVVGAVALIISAKPELAGEVETIENLLEQTAQHLTTSQVCGGLDGGDIPNNTYGYGRIDVLAAVNKALKEFDVPIIKVDAFGYKPNAKKIAILSNPLVGYNSMDTYTPSGVVDLKDAYTHLPVFSASPVAWNSGATHTSSGDQAWRFDFTAFNTPGKYYVADGAIRSEDFYIADTVYHDVLNTAFKTFYYQRCGVNKLQSIVGAAYQDGACHTADLTCKFINDETNTSLEKNLSGGWHDAGDYNKYVNFTADVIQDLCFSYEFNPAAWNDDMGIPESSNGIPDLLDEIKVELDWLLKMQDTDGGVYSLVGVKNYATASPPSSDAALRYYGPKTTSASLTAALCFSAAYRQFSKINNPDIQTYASTLQSAAIAAWDWAIANPSTSYYNSGIIAAGEQEISGYTLDMRKLIAAVHLYAATGDVQYLDYVELNYSNSHLIQWNFVYPFENLVQLGLVYFASLPQVDALIAEDIRNTFVISMDTDSGNIPAFDNDVDPYYAYLSDANYTWGSNKTKTDMGNLYRAYHNYMYDPLINDELEEYSGTYLHYIHGVNPNGICFMSNMGGNGAEKSCNTIYHSWFNDGSAAWDDVLESTYGPAPGFIPGGVNPTWSLDDCCNTTCGASDPDCILLSPPSSQPIEKSYRDWNTGWPQNSWEVTEPAIYSQASYLALLASQVNQYSNDTSDQYSIEILDKDLYFSTFPKSIILQSPSGLKYSISVTNDGEIELNLVSSIAASTSKSINAGVAIKSAGQGLIIKSMDLSLWKINATTRGSLRVESLATLPTNYVNQIHEDLLIDEYPNGLILTDETGTCYKLTVDDSGKLYCNPTGCD